MAGWACITAMAVAAATSLFGCGPGAAPAADARAVNAREGAGMKRETAMFGAGCFWGVEATFRRIPGVTDTAVGYAGGSTPNPSYKQVCTDTTGHAEVVRVEFDPGQVSYEALLDVFLRAHDPTQVNRQGPDVGTQYRSVVFTFSADQERLARSAIGAAQARYSRPIATQIVPEAVFTRAEEYHQRYLEKHGLEQCHLPGPG